MSENSSPMHSPIAVYLDQADWSYLQDGRFLEAEARLRSAAEAGRVVFLISWTHMVETAKLDTGLESRVRFLHAFPGTLQVTTAPGELALQGIDALLAEIDGRTPEPLRYQATVMATKSVEDLINETRQCASARVFHEATWESGQRARAFRGGKSKSEIVGDERNTAACLGGETEAFRLHQQQQQSIPAEERYAPFGAIGKIACVAERVMETISEKTGLIPPIERRSCRGAMLGFALFRWVGEKTGLLGLVGEHFDPVFARSVMVFMPKEARRDPQLLAKVLSVWKDIGRRARVAASLACRAVIIEALHYDPARKGTVSDEADKEHALHAPLVRVFTSDKRNVGPLTTVLRHLPRTIRVLRTQHLDEVADVVEELADART